MRTSGCTIQQALTQEALSLVKQSIVLAKRRGHAQVTPLHVASTMLTSPIGVLRTACLQSHSHPLQCKALELCFNVALNRLPASNSNPMLAPQSQQHPSISNALVAAFKRAQAHQRRGSIENQQQPLLAVKIELQHLIISILDDPSVSRVMREAGFSSTQVKSKVELQSSKNDNHNHNDNDNNNNDNNNLSSASVDDVAAVITDLAEKRRSVVVVGECLGSVESVVEAAIGRIEKRDELVPGCLEEVKFINLSISSFRNRSRVEVDEKVMELKSLIRSCLGKGVILYVGDIKWTIDYRQNYYSITNQTRRNYYCPVEHMIMELGKLTYVRDNNDHHDKGSVWIMGIATFQTYMRCKSGNPSLETLLAIHPLTIPQGSLKLALMPHSEIQSESFDENYNQNKTQIIEEKQVSCCGECSAKFETEAKTLQKSNNTHESTSSTPLPAWLQQYKNERENDQKCVTVTEVYKKWNSICNSIHKNSNNNNNTIISSEKSIQFSCILPNSSPTNSETGFSYHHHHNYNNNNNEFNFIQHSPKKKLKNHHNYHNDDDDDDDVDGSTRCSASSGSDVVLEEGEYVSRFKELNSENLNRVCSALEKKVSWHYKNVVGDIASAVLQCRSGMGRRSKGKIGYDHDFKEDTWLLFQGNDVAAKEKVARELSKIIFGSETSNLVTIKLTSTELNSNNIRMKRSRDEEIINWRRFAEEVSINPHRVFLIEDVDEQSDYCSQMGFKRAIEEGRIINSNGKHVFLRDAIVILSAWSRPCSPPMKLNVSQEKENGSCLDLDLNLNISIDDRAAHDQSIHDDVGLLDSVDGQILFQIKEL